MDFDVKLIRRVQTNNAQDTEELCGEFTREHLLSLPHSLLLLEGELGAGKTTFCRGFMRALEIPENINSPTFNLLNEYEGALGRFHHYDLYRLGSPEEAEELGFVERWSTKSEEKEGSPLIQAVEWWSRARPCFPTPVPAFYIEFDYNVDEDEPTRGVSIYHVVVRSGN